MAFLLIYPVCVYPYLSSDGHLPANSPLDGFILLSTKAVWAKNYPTISGISSGKETAGPSYGRACPFGPSTTKASWFPFFPSYHSFPGSCPLSYPEVSSLHHGKTHLAPLKGINSRCWRSVETEACQASLVEWVSEDRHLQLLPHHWRGEIIMSWTFL